MEDGIIKQTGNSRYLKSNIPPGTTWEQALALLTVGEFPVDFNGIAPDGWEKLGTALNKANLLSDLTAAKYGNVETVNAVLDILSKAAIFQDGIFTNVGGAQIPTVEVGSYIGTGTNGEANQNRITFSRRPQVVLIVGATGVGGYIPVYALTAQYVASGYYNGGDYAFSLRTDRLDSSYARFDDTTNTLFWYTSDKYNPNQMNNPDQTYFYVALFD